MRYLQHSLQPGETVKYIAKLHFFLFAQPFVLLLSGCVLYSAVITRYGGLLMLFFGVVSLLQRLLVKLGSLYAVTDKRLILKTGIIRRQVTELVLNKCEGLRVNQSIAGRIFNFGTIHITTGGIINHYTFVAKPLDFRKAITGQIGQI
jgi:uncharacterized membrane protein YdbT with pleckstrin-like domain